MTKLAFPAELSSLQSDARLLHQIQLLDKLFSDVLSKIRSEKESFAVRIGEQSKESANEYTLKSLARLGDLFLDSNAEIASLIVETALVFANLFGHDDFIGQVGSYLKEQHTKKRSEKPNEDVANDEEDEEGEEEEKALDDLRKDVLEGSLNISVAAIQFFEFQISRFLFLTHTETVVLEEIVMEGKRHVSDSEEAKESLSTHARTLFCRFSVDCDDARNELLECPQRLKAVLVHFLLCQMAAL